MLNKIRLQQNQSKLKANKKQRYTFAQRLSLLS